ncbi:hypothetical protein EJ04DRAFT_438758 [Polyplosphaeria fusca]|uniref:DUF7703 domain-containing protein n=1 Tax=Polyplosphaeria fusca TaxID=682080 RepID=A0A9P4QYQ0_9PLEO|nr:hypothetical protein EJ04DRAFT_438758 [Polyplosphaeria fusca]
MARAPEDTGIGTNIQLPFVNSLVIISFIAIAWYNVAELTVIMQSFFRRHSGLYYWSLLVANWGIFFHGLGMFLKFFHVNDKLKGHTLANTVIVWVGWIMMITGQSVVLWSRLNLVLQARWTRWVLLMIIVDGTVLHTTTGVLTFLTNLSSNPEPWKSPYSIVERTQVTIFFVQEVVLSVIYIWKTTSMLKSEGPLFVSYKSVRGSRGRKVLIHTITMSFIIICLDLTLIALEFSGLYDIQTSYKGAVYSVKLKMEFTILNALMDLVKGNLSDSTSAPHTASKSAHCPRAPGTGMRSHNRHSAALGHSAGAYSRMDEHGGASIQLRDLKATDVLKTTTTEVRVDRIETVVEDREDFGGKGGNETSLSTSSSEVYIIEHNKS